jgi:hypothetical protein
MFEVTFSTLQLGTRVLMCYGKRSSTNLLKYLGFVCVEITWHLLHILCLYIADLVPTICRFKLLVTKR